MVISGFLSLRDAAKALSGEGIEVRYGTLWRAARLGTVARSGERVRLRCVRVGGRILIRLAWLHEYAAQLAEADLAHFQKPATSGESRPLPGRGLPRTPTRLDRIASACDAEGI
jgi:hypothetical protein